MNGSATARFCLHRGRTVLYSPFPIHPICGSILGAVNSLQPARHQHTRDCLTVSQQAASSHIQPVSLPGTAEALPRPFTACRSATSNCGFTAQTVSPSAVQPLLWSARASELGGVYSIPQQPLYPPQTSNTPCSRHHRPRSSLSRRFCSSTSSMPTVSQPQTPAALDSPLREHRHRPVERLTDRLETPSLDDRSYRVIRLPNQLEVLLVHDAETDKASAAMDVNVGNFSDESEMPGMAHAVEHCKYLLATCSFFFWITLIPTQYCLWEPKRYILALCYHFSFETETMCYEQPINFSSVSD
jgi:hypothetical protein